MVGGQFAAVGDVELFTDQVESADLLADGVLDLQSRVDFEEVDLALFGHHEFAGAQSHIVDGFEQAARIAFQLFGRPVRKERRGRLLDQLLVAALHGAVARGIHGEVAVRIASALRLDVASLVDEAFHEVFVQVAALQRVVVHVEAAELIVVVHQRDAASAAAVGTLEHQRISVRVREVEQQTHVGNRMGDARDRRHLGRRRHLTRGDLVAQIDQCLRIRADPCRAGIDHLARERGDFGKESIARMHRIGTAALQNVDEQVLVEIRVFVGVARQQVRLVGHLHVLRVTVLFGIHRDRGNPHLPGGAHHTKRDFAAVRHQKFVDIFRHVVNFALFRTFSRTRFSQKSTSLFVRLHKRRGNFDFLR